MLLYTKVPNAVTSQPMALTLTYRSHLVLLVHVCAAAIGQPLQAFAGLYKPFQAPMHPPLQCLTAAGSSAVDHTSSVLYLPWRCLPPA